MYRRLYRRINRYVKMLKKEHKPPKIRVVNGTLVAISGAYPTRSFTIEFRLPTANGARGRVRRQNFTECALLPETGSKNLDCALLVIEGQRFQICWQPDL